MAQGDNLTNQRLNAVWQIAATLNMGNESNIFLTILKTQPAGIYPLANMAEAAIWLKWELGKSGSLAKWFPEQVYASLIAKIVDFGYNRTAIGDLYQPPQNAAGGDGQCTCSADAKGSPARTVLCFKWNFVDFTQQSAGTLNAGTWIFSNLSAGNYVLVFEDYATTESLPTAFLTVT